MTDTDTAVIDVLSVARGDIRLSFEPGDPDGKQTIERMLRDGYAIFVETDQGLRRVKRFNAKRSTYVITDVPAEQAAPPTRGGKERQVPVRGSRARAVGATAGG